MPGYRHDILPCIMPPEFYDVKIIFSKCNYVQWGSSTAAAGIEPGSDNILSVSKSHPSSHSNVILIFSPLFNSILHILEKKQRNFYSQHVVLKDYDFIYCMTQVLFHLIFLNICSNPLHANYKLYKGKVDPYLLLQEGREGP